MRDRASEEREKGVRRKRLPRFGAFGGTGVSRDTPRAMVFSRPPVLLKSERRAFGMFVIESGMLSSACLCDSGHQ